MGPAGTRVPALGRCLLPVQPGALRDAVREWLRPRDLATVPGRAASEGTVLARPPLDEPRVLPPPPAAPHTRATIPPAGRPGHVGVVDQPRAAVRDAGRLATSAGMVAPGRRRHRPDPDAAVLRRRMAPV